MTRPRKSPRLRRALVGTARCSTRCECIAEPPPSPLVVWNYRGPFGVNPVVCASSTIMWADHRGQLAHRRIALDTPIHP